MDSSIHSTQSIQSTQSSHGIPGTQSSHGIPSTQSSHGIPSTQGAEGKAREPYQAPGILWEQEFEVLTQSL